MFYRTIGYKFASNFIDIFSDGRKKWSVHKREALLVRFHPIILPIYLFTLFRSSNSSPVNCSRDCIVRVANTHPTVSIFSLFSSCRFPPWTTLWLSSKVNLKFGGINLFLSFSAQKGLHHSQKTCLSNICLSKTQAHKTNCCRTHQCGLRPVGYACLGQKWWKVQSESCDDLNLGLIAFSQCCRDCLIPGVRMLTVARTHSNAFPWTTSTYGVWKLMHMLAIWSVSIGELWVFGFWT